MARPLPPRAAPHGFDAVTGAVGAVLPSFEIVDSRFEEWRKLGPFEAIADNVLHSHWVHGPEVAAFQALDLASIDVVTRVNGVERTRGCGANVLGSPLQALHWLANGPPAKGPRAPAAGLGTTARG